MIDQLSLYNGALRILGERKLSTLTEEREPRRALDDVWFDTDGTLSAVHECLEQGLWNFASKAVEISPETDVVPQFGYTHAFAKPDDFVRTAMLCNDEDFKSPMLNYVDEGQYWFTHEPQMYVQYISNERGQQPSTWPRSFSKYLEMFMAVEVCERLTQNATKQETLERKLNELMVKARSLDAMAQPTTFLPEGSWVRSRAARMGDRGKRNRLIG